MTINTIFEIDSLQTYREVFKQEELWLPWMKEICRRHDLPVTELQRQQTGSAIVYATGGCMIKFFAPLWPEEFVREQIGLAHFQQLDDMPVPRLHASGQIENWQYLIIEQLPGVMIHQVWKILELSERLGLMAQVGELMAQLQALPAPEHPAIAQDWQVFVQQQCQGFVKHQTEAGLSQEWAESLQAWLLEQVPQLPALSSRLLHCDLTHDHFLVQQQQGQWRITGLIDFGDAMLAHPYYEFAAPLVFLTGNQTNGDVALRHSLLRAYGFAEAELGPELENHLWSCILLHRFVNVAWYLRHLCPPEITTPEALQRFFCAL